MSEFASGAAHSSLGGQIAESARPDAHAVRIVGRHRRRHRRRVCARRPRHRHRRIDSRALHGQRHRRPQADARPAQPRRHHPARAELRYRRPDGAQRLRRRGRARRHDRRRPRRRRDQEERRPLRDRLHEVPEGRRAEGRSHRHRARLSRPGPRCGLGRSTRRSTPCAARARPSWMCAFPKWLLDAKGEFYNAIRYPEFTAQIAEYLATIGPSYPKNIDQLIERAHARQRTRAPTARVRTRALGLDEARSRQRHAGRLPLHVGARSRACRWCARSSTASSRRRSSTPSSIRRRRGGRALIAAPPECPGGGRAARGVEPRQPHRLSRSDRARRDSRATICRWDFRFSVRPSASRSCSRSATASSRHDAPPSGPYAAIAQGGHLGALKNQRVAFRNRASDSAVTRL